MDRSSAKSITGRPRGNVFQMKERWKYLLSLRVSRQKQHTSCHNRRRHYCEYNLRLPPCLHHCFSFAVLCDCLDIVC